jgi:hypothetical protein
METLFFMNYEEAQIMLDDNLYLEGQAYKDKQISLILIIQAEPDLYALGQAVQDFLTYGKIC